METILVTWFKALFTSRTPAKSVLDVAVAYRVTWTEILAKMNEIGYAGNAVDLRYEWDRIYVSRKLHNWCNNKLREAGEIR